MKKLSVDELLRLACIYAYRDQEEYLRCICEADDQEEIDKTKAFMKQLREYRMKRWGATKLEKVLSEAKEVTVQEFLKCQGQ